MSVTFKDVAKLAGVSTQTVSRVTNGSQSVAPETRKKVMAAIDQLGYVPNKGAQLLSRAKTRVIGLITLDIGLHGVSQIAEGIRNQAQESGYGMALSVLNTPCLENIRVAVRELKSQKIECVIVNVYQDKDAAESLAADFPELHFVFIDVPPETKVLQVCADNYQGARSAAELLISQGRRSLLLITGPAESNASQQRLQGWQDVLEAHQVRKIGPFSGNWLAESGYRLTRDALSQGQVFDAVLVASDQMALGVLRALSEHSLTVPGQIAVIGFDNTSDSAYFIPPLTTVGQDFSAIGQQAVERVLASSEQPDDESPAQAWLHAIPTQLIERSSTGDKRDNSSYDKQQIQALLNKVSQLLP
jgi:DNA-binding LacI/PurR family transcriptional regulator